MNATKDIDTRPTLAEAVATAREMRQVLVDMEVVSHGRTRALDAPTTASRSRSVLLQVDEEPYPHELYRERWRRASAAEAAGVLADARAELERMRKAPPPPDGLLERGSHHWWLKIAGDFSRPIGELAREHGVSRQAIRRRRDRYELTPVSEEA